MSKRVLHACDDCERQEKLCPVAHVATALFTAIVNFLISPTAPPPPLSLLYGPIMRIPFSV